MLPRSRAVLVAAALLLAVWLVGVLLPAPYVVMRPGPTINLLAESKGKEYIQIEGAPTYRDDGALRLLTVVSSGPDDTVSLFDAMVAWLTPGQSVYRYDDIYRPQDTSKTVKEDAGVDMVNSQDAATAVALNRLGMSYPTHVQVLGVAPDGPSDGVLKVHDVLLRVADHKVNDTDSAVKAIQQVQPGSKVRLVIERDGAREAVVVTTAESTRDKGKAALHISIGTGYDFPVDVRVRLGQDIGGPSAGMMFATAIYDTMTPGSLTGGKSVAGTGTIDAEGHVGPIGGIQQKIAGAEEAGAQLFLAPGGNCDEVAHLDWDRSQMRVIRVDTFDQAISGIEAWRDDPTAPMLECTS